LWSVDTYFTPQAGRRGLIIPGGSYKYLTPEWTTNKGQATGDAIRELIGGPRLAEMFEKGISPFVLGGEHGSATDLFDNWLAYQATKMKVNFGPGHFDSPWSHLSQMGNPDPKSPVGFRGGQKGIEYLEHYLSTLSDNAIARALDRSDWLSNVKSRFNLGESPFKFMKGGFVPGSPSTPVPATLHGGEYVLNAEAVRRIGMPVLAQLNKAKFSVPEIPSMRIPSPSLQAMSGASSSTQNVNIYVDTFVGEPEWFKSMMKEYNTKILPRNQKAAGLENRVISTYNGLNRGN
jgi:hypothetical protein